MSWLRHLLAAHFFVFVCTRPLVSIAWACVVCAFMRVVLLCMLMYGANLRLHMCACECVRLCAYASCAQVKVLLQTQTKGEFKGVVHCIKDVVATHGFVGLYRGLLTPLVGSMAENAVLFSSYGTAQRVITGLRGESSSSEYGGREIVRLLIHENLFRYSQCHAAVVICHCSSILPTCFHGSTKQLASHSFKPHAVSVVVCYEWRLCWPGRVTRSDPDRAGQV